MKKQLFLCLLVLLCLALTGCHGKNEATAFALPDTFDTTRNFEITFWAKNDTNMTQVQIYKDAIAGFEAAYPNVTVNLRLYTDYGRIYNDVITNIATSTTPNVCITYPDHIATYLTGGTGTVVPLSDILTDEKWGLGGSEVNFDAPTAREVVPKFLEECKISGVTYALPFMRSTEAMYVNKTFVEKLGYTLPETLTWDFVWEVSEAAMKKDADGNYLVNGQKVMIPFIYKSTDNMMIQYLHQMNAGYSAQEGDILIFNDQTRAVLKEIASHGKTGAFSTFKISSYPANFLNAGQCIFACDSTAGATWMGSDAPLIDIAEENLVEFETAVMTIPQLDPQNPSMISQGPSVCIFNKEDPQEVLASWLFMQYLLTNDVQIAYAQTEGYVPVTLKAQQSDMYQDYLSREGEDNQLYYNIKLQASRLLIDNTENTFVTPVFNGSASLRDAAGQMIESVTKSTRRRQTVDDEYLDKLFNEMNALYRLDQTGAIGVQKDLGPLPSTASALLIALVAVWALMGLYALSTLLRSRRKQ
ncbi:MAG: extracellular solute-binding protein [Clostridia bacterium]|nr:extracellular solute-binding protein [Clostridia bacterium]